MLLEHTSKTNIKAWQTFLNQQNCGPIAEDGIWGLRTAEASKKFQTLNGLAADGLIGPGTIAKAETKGFKLPESFTQSSGNSTSLPTPANNSNNVFDISHGNTLNSNGFQEAYNGGMRLVFHKATGGFETVRFTDSEYAARRPHAEAAGLLWGAYHFANGYESGQTQAEGFLNFLKSNGGIENTLMVLDYEPDVGGGKTYKDMNLEQARDFVNHIYSETGIYPGLYGARGMLFRDLRAANVPADDVLYKCWLWAARYWHIQPNLSGLHWEEYTFWQYGSGVNAWTPETSGMETKVDRSFYNLAMGDLAAFHQAHSVGKMPV